MKTILCYGDSNVRGVIPEKIRGTLVKVYDKNKRWTGILQKLLGDEYNVIKEGMGGRTTAFDEINPGRPYRNGLKGLPLFLEAHFPIDLIIFLLGTNDTKIQYNKSVEEIIDGLRRCIETIQHSNKGPNENPPKVLILAPAPIKKISSLAPELDDTSIKKSESLPIFLKKLAEKMDCHFLDISKTIKVSEIDGMHLDDNEHIKLAQSIHDKIKYLFEKDNNKNNE